MVPTLVSTWRKMRSNEKSGRHACRSHSQVIPSGGVRLHALSTTAVASARPRAASVELSSSASRATTDALDGNLSGFEIDVVRVRPRRESHTRLPTQLKVFVGSWNMAAKDPFAVDKGSAAYMGDAAAAEKLRGLLPPGYDLYVLGTQEKVTKHLHAAVLARLHSAPENLGRRYVTLRQASKRERERERQRSRSHSRRSRSRSRSADRSSESSNASPSRHSESDSSQVERFRQGSFAVEASASRHGDKNNQSEGGEEPPRESIKEVRGRGDGAFLSAKCTSIAVYCASDLASVVAIDKIATHKFSWNSGSKGGVAVMLRVATGSGDRGSAHQTLTFANCHLEANKATLRRQQLATLSTKLGQALCGAKDLASSSDHVVWMGDFNYRVHTLDGESVLKLLASGKHLDVHDRYDSMKDDLEALPSMAAFSEPTKWPSFLPTYKKIPGRPARLDVSDPHWPARVYRVLYKEPFYKGGKAKARVPGWCDRILYCSRGGALRLLSWLDVEQVDARDNYRAVNDGFCESDHSPVFCTFDWTVSTTHALTWG